MNRINLTILPIISCLLILFLPALACAQAVRAGIIGATRSLYKAEMKEIDKALRYRIVTPKQNLFRRDRHSAPKPKHQDSSKSISRPVSLDDLALEKPEIQSVPDGNLISSELEINANGWERF